MRESMKLRTFSLSDSTRSKNKYYKIYINICRSIPLVKSSKRISHSRNRWLTLGHKNSEC